VHIINFIFVFVMLPVAMRKVMTSILLC